MQTFIETVIQFVGRGTLTAVTFGRYRTRGESDLLAEGAIGLATIAVLSWAVYTWWPG
jgi:hypothetical protein